MAGNEWRSRSLELRRSENYETKLLLRLVICLYVEVSQDDGRTEDDGSTEENCELSAQ